MTLAYIALGANLGNPLAQVVAATTALNHLPETRLAACSPWYRSKAVGPGDQDDYINGVAAVDTDLPPADLLRALKKIETDHGRVATVRWGPRHLDLDILLYGRLCIDSEHLQIPHPRMLERNFVIIPLQDIAPNLELPGGQAISALATRLGRADLDLVTTA